MNTTKKLIVLCLAALMGVVSLIPSTFSWYNRNSTPQRGDGMHYERNNLFVSNGSISMETVQFAQKADGKVDYDADKKKKIRTGNGWPSYSVPANKTYYYRTTFTNTGSTVAYAGFYLNNITNSSQVSVGNNYPTVSEKITGYPSRIRSAYSKTRIYFDNSKDVSNWSGSGNSIIYLVSKNAATNALTSEQMSTTTQGTTTYYYKDLPENTSEFFIARANNDTDAKTVTGYKRTKTFTKAPPSTVYELTGNITNDDNNYAAVETHVDEDALGVDEYYKEVTTTTNQEFYISLPGNYNAESVAYQVKNNADSEKITVDSVTGACTVTNGSLSNQPGVKAVLTGAWGDTMDVVTSVKLPNEVDNIPVSQNIKIPIGESVNIEWYVTNRSGSKTSTFNIYSTI